MLRLMWRTSLAFVALLSACGGASAPAAAPAATPAPVASAEKPEQTTGPKTFTHPEYPSLEMTDEKVGDGPEVKAGDDVRVRYVGRLEDGSVFDESSGATFAIGKGVLIKGWDLGVPGMRVGGVRKLHVPASLGYGSKGSPPKIPPFAALEFTIEVLSIEKK